MSSAPMNEMGGRRALVVGASSGIGREVALRFAALGADVAFHGRRRDRLEEAVTRSGGGHVVVADVSDPAQCDALVAEAVAELGGLDALVFAASSSRLSLVQDTDAEEWARVFASNVIAPALVARATLPHLSPGGVCAFISSESVGAPYHGLIPYGASKAALEEVVRGLRIEHPAHRFACIRVGNTAPTEFGRDFSPELAGELMPKWVALGRIPAEAMDAEELGRAIADTVAITLASPSIELQDMVVRAPGGHFAGDVTSLVAEVDAHHEAVYGSDQ
jgi:NAD(P)-dependent dehydrogenase (short-subunit alcohol dehydrogenase family)